MSNIAGWLVVVLSLESNCTEAPPSADISMIPLLLDGVLTHPCTSPVMSTLTQ